MNSDGSFDPHASGAVTMADVLAVLAQFGLACGGPP